MQQQNLPFNFKEVFKLTNLGLSPDLFKFGSVTFESQKYICVKDANVSSKIMKTFVFQNEVFFLVDIIKYLSYIIGLRNHRYNQQFLAREKANES
tara:strand:+ start:81 stop:365 length:285 start_codon:yes stop_codon:yes gene_type:complete